VSCEVGVALHVLQNLCGEQPTSRVGKSNQYSGNECGSGSALIRLSWIRIQFLISKSVFSCNKIDKNLKNLLRKSRRVKVHGLARADKHPESMDPH
jgi:hypothetical protein